MSVKVISRVWDHSQQRGSLLLLLLAMADIADELGILFAGSEYLAQRARLANERHVRRMLLTLEEAAELRTIRALRADGTSLPNYYVVTVGAGDDALEQAEAKLHTIYQMRGADVIMPLPKVSFALKQWTTGILSLRGEGGVYAPLLGEGVDAQEGVGAQGGKKGQKGGAWTPSSKGGAVQPPDPLYPLREEGDLNSPSGSDSLDAGFWKTTLAQLEMQMTRSTYTQWLQGTSGILAGDNLTVTVRNSFAVDWLENRLNDLINRTVADLAGRPIAITYEVRS